jgi:hypothetical protein
MSTSETVTLNKGPCPCGAGHIAQHVTTQDNPWSTADTAYSVECLRCCTEWRLENKTLVLRSSEDNYRIAKAKEKAASAPLLSLVNHIVTDYFARFAAPNKKVEHAEMIRPGITAMSYRQYLEHRRKGGSISEASYGLRNEEWLLSEAVAHSRGPELRSLIGTHLAAREAANEASKEIIRRKVA